MWLRACCLTLSLVVIMGVVLILDILAEEDLPWEFYLFFEVKASEPTSTQVYLDLGNGYQESYSFRVKMDSSNSYTQLRFKLPKQDIAGIRIDPMGRKGKFSIRNVALKDEFGNIIKRILLDKVRANKDIGDIKFKDGVLNGQTTGNGRDPAIILELDYPLQYATLYPLYQRFWQAISLHQGRWARKMGLMLLIMTSAFILNLYNSPKNAQNAR